MRDLKDNWVEVASLVVFAVGLTTLAVAVVVRTIMPEIPLGPAIALGAVVAPPEEELDWIEMSGVEGKRAAHAELRPRARRRCQLAADDIAVVNRPSQ